MIKWIYVLFIISFSVTASDSKSVILTTDLSADSEIAIQQYSTISADGTRIAFTAQNKDIPVNYNSIFRLFYHDISKSETIEIKHDPESDVIFSGFLSPSISPDGELIVALAHINGEYNQNIYVGNIVFDVRSKNLRTITNANGEELDQVAYSSRFSVLGSTFYF